jgi:hypothetical protein
LFSQVAKIGFKHFKAMRINGFTGSQMPLFEEIVLAINHFNYQPTVQLT